MPKGLLKICQGVGGWGKNHLKIVLTTFNGYEELVCQFESRGQANKTPAPTFPKLPALSGDLQLYSQR